jgi:hypothetical protein
MLREDAPAGNVPASTLLIIKNLGASLPGTVGDLHRPAGNTPPGYPVENRISLDSTGIRCRFL